MVCAHIPPPFPTLLEQPVSLLPSGQPDLLRRLSMPSSSASVAPVPNAQVPRLRVLVAAGRGEGGGVAGGGGSPPGNPEPRVARVPTQRVILR